MPLKVLVSLESGCLYIPGQLNMS